MRSLSLGKAQVRTHKSLQEMLRKGRQGTCNTTHATAAQQKDKTQHNSPEAVSGGIPTHDTSILGDALTNKACEEAQLAGPKSHIQIEATHLNQRT